jgi:hypothetical protein
MYSAKTILPRAVAIVVLISVIAGAFLWWRVRRAPLPSQSIAIAPHTTVDQLEQEELRNEEPPPALPLEGPIELSPDVAVKRADQLRSCGKVIAFVNQCVAQNIPLDGTPWSKMHGYSMPLPPIPAPRPGFTLQPNPSVCARASEWQTYCVANVYPRQ